MTLANKYRPRTFSDLVGQKATRTTLEQMIRQDKVPTGLLFSGVRGAGKTTSGRILAAALNCTAPRDNEPPPCGACASCKAIFDGTSLDVLEQDAASNGNVGDIRTLIDTLRFSVGGNYRVVLLDEAHSMSREAFNALLKTLEEPPPLTVFILLTTEPNRILETVLSRLMKFEFRMITTQDIANRLEYICQSEDIQMDSSLLLKIAERAGGGMRDAIMTMEQASLSGATTQEQFDELVGEHDFAPDLIRAMAKREQDRVFELLDEQLRRTGDVSSISSEIIRTLRDCLVLSAGGSIAKTQETLAKRQALSALVEQPKIVAALKLLWDLKTKVRTGEDQRAMLELCAVMLTEVLSAGTAPQMISRPTGQKLGLADLQRAR